MRMMLRPDLRCPHRCEAAVIEFRDGDAPAEYRCKVHGALEPPLRPLPRQNHPNTGTQP